jgi:hypothetical protein
MADPQFTRGPARRPVQIGGEPLLQWATGLQTKDRRLYAGWIAERGKHDEFDAAKEITPPVAKIPTPVTKDHIRAHWIARGWEPFVEARLDDTIRWSMQLSRSIAEGFEPSEPAEPY